MDSNEISKSLGQVPELVQATNTLIKDNVRKDELIAKILQKRPQAEIPQTEIDKVTQAVEQTPCALPDTREIAKAIAVPVMDEIRRSLANEIKQTVTNTVSSIPVECIHKHTTLVEMTQMAEKKLRRSVYVALGCCIFVLIFVGILALRHFNSTLYLGAEYREVIKSEFTTEAERQMLTSGTYSFSLVPKESWDNKKYIKQKIRRNKEILRQRQAEAKTNDGDYSTSVPLER